MGFIDKDISLPYNACNANVHVQLSRYLLYALKFDIIEKCVFHILKKKACLFSR